MAAPPLETFGLDEMLTPETFGLDEMLKALRGDLDAANADLPDGEARLQVDQVEMEVAFTLERSSEKGAGLSFKVFGVGLEGSGKGSTNQIHANRIKLTLKPTGDSFGVAGGFEPTE